MPVDKSRVTAPPRLCILQKGEYLLLCGTSWRRATCLAEQLYGASLVADLQFLLSSVSLVSSSKPRVSIGLPVYNGEYYLAEALESLLGQTYRDFEVIICDNASTDNTGRICRSYAGRDARIHYVRSDLNRGGPGNYRLAFKLSRGKYFRWATHDDLSSPESLERCVEVLDRDPSIVLAYPKTRIIDEGGQTIADYEDGLHLMSPKASDRFVQLLERIGLGNAMYGLIRADILKTTALTGDFVANDRILLAELSLRGMFWEVPGVFFYRRIHAAANSSQKDIGQLLEYFYPGTGKQVALVRWRLLWEQFRAVAQSPISRSEKVQLARRLVRGAIWDRERLAVEVWRALLGRSRTVHE